MGCERAKGKHTTAVFPAFDCGKRHTQACRLLNAVCVTTAAELLGLCRKYFIFAPMEVSSLSPHAESASWRQREYKEGPKVT